MHAELTAVLIPLPQYAFEDFAVRQVALLLNKTDDVAKYTNRSLVRIYPCRALPNRAYAIE